MRFFSWPVSRVLSFKAIINLDIVSLQCSSDHGNGRATQMFHILHHMEFTANYCYQYFGWALTPPFHHCPKRAVYFCCTFPQVTLAWRYQAWLLYGARTFLTITGVIAQPTCFIIIIRFNLSTLEYKIIKRLLIKNDKPSLQNNNTICDIFV